MKNVLSVLIGILWGIAISFFSPILMNLFSRFMSSTIAALFVPLTVLILVFIGSKLFRLK